VKTFFDTSVLVAAFWHGHPQHEASIARFAAADRKHSGCGIHTLAEVYAVMSALPVKPKIPAEQVMLFVEEVRKRLTPIALDEGEYLATLQHAAENGFTGGQVYDALLLRCAAKAGAQTIYTWNLPHFRAIAPDLAGRIRTP
jgi:predicted nucleic acid-binding protein